MLMLRTKRSKGERERRRTSGASLFSSAIQSVVGLHVCAERMQKKEEEEEMIKGGFFVCRRERRGKMIKADLYSLGKCVVCVVEDDDTLDVGMISI